MESAVRCGSPAFLLLSIVAFVGGGADDGPARPSCAVSVGACVASSTAGASISRAGAASVLATSSAAEVSVSVSSVFSIA